MSGYLRIQKNSSKDLLSSYAFYDAHRYFLGYAAKTRHEEVFAAFCTLNASAPSKLSAYVPEIEEQCNVGNLSICIHIMQERLISRMRHGLSAT